MRISKASLEKNVAKTAVKLSKLDQDIATTEKKLNTLKDQRRKLGNQKATMTEMINLADQLDQ